MDPEYWPDWKYPDVRLVLQIRDTIETDDGPIVFRSWTAVKLLNEWRVKSGERAFRREDASGIGRSLAGLCWHHSLEVHRYAGRLLILDRGKVAQQYTVETEDGNVYADTILNWLWTKTYGCVTDEENETIEGTMTELRRCWFNLTFPIDDL